MINERINKERDALLSRIQLLDKLDQITDIENENFETMVMLIYLDKEGVSQTYTILNDLGYRVPSPRGERKYTSNDVTALLEANLDNKKINGNLRYLVNGMMTRKHKHISWMDLMLKIVNEIELN